MCDKSMKAKRIYRYAGMALLFLLACGGYAAAQDAADIALPEVTTEVSGEAPAAGEDAVPDFTSVLPADEGSVPLPELPGYDPAIELPDTTDAQNWAETDKDVFVEGMLGGGYPSFFTGNFSIYRTHGSSPFLLKFGHESVNGYGRKALSTGFYDSATTVGGSKTFFSDGTIWNLSGTYDRNDRGLQSISRAFENMTQQTLGGSVSAHTSVSDSIAVDFNVDPSWYNRYGGEFSDAAVTITKAETGASMISMSPRLAGTWKKYGFEIGISGMYTLQNNVGSNSVITGYKGNLTDQATHRGEYGLGVSWANEYIKVFERASMVVGTVIGDNKLLVPFTVGAALSLPLSSRDLTFSAEAGMDSYQPQYRDLEKKYAFTNLCFIPGETTDWYSKAELSIPAGSMITLSGTAEYRSTARENGEWVPVYSVLSPAGLYGYAQAERTIAATTAAVSMNIGVLTAGIDWKAHWKDVPVLEYEHTVGVRAAVQSSDASLGGDVSVKFFIDDSADDVPDLGLYGYCRMTNALRLAVNGDDILKLLSGETRVYAGKYVRRSGSATILVKFFF